MGDESLHGPYGCQVVYNPDTVDFTAFYISDKSQASFVAPVPFIPDNRLAHESDLDIRERRTESRTAILVNIRMF